MRLNPGCEKVKLSGKSTEFGSLHAENIIPRFHFPHPRKSGFLSGNTARLQGFSSGCLDIEQEFGATGKSSIPFQPVFTGSLKEYFTFLSTVQNSHFAGGAHHGNRCAMVAGMDHDFAFTADNLKLGFAGFRDHAAILCFAMIGMSQNGCRGTQKQHKGRRGQQLVYIHFHNSLISD